MKLGLAVARRWTVNGTFLPREDVIKPLSAGEAEYPPAFAEGVLEGLLLDHNGYLRIHPDDLPLVVAIAKRLPGDRTERALRELTARVKDALLSYTFGDEDQSASTTSLWRLADESMAEEGEATTLWEFLTSIASRIEALQESEPSYALGEDYEDGEDD